MKFLERMEDIIAFSEIREFIDMPVRTYSSGMYLRLAFSVAIHTDPELLLIDEILSVGDEAFQKKSRDALLRFNKRRSYNHFCLPQHGCDKGDM